MYRTAFFTVLLVIAATSPAALGEGHWPSWRGPDMNGVAVDANPPTEWSETKNVKWKVALPGLSSSTPVVWGNKIFIQTAVPTGDAPPAPAQGQGRRGGGNPHNVSSPSTPYKFNVVCFDRTTGKLLWEKTACEKVPHEGHHPTASFASYSPVTDGNLLWVSFGSRGLYCYDLDGNLKWNRDLMEMRIKMNFGEGSSPALAGDAVVVLMDHEGDSKIFAFDKTTGNPIWEVRRQETTSWSTPVAVEVDGKLQVITSATDRIRSYDAATGELVWECDGLTPNAIPTPVIGFGNAYCTSGFRGFALKAIELGHTGDLTDTPAIKWQVDHGTPYVSSPLLYGERIYVTSGLNPVLSCYDAKTGAPHFVEQRLAGLGQIYASPVGAGGHVYIADREGNIAVLKHSDALEVVAMNKLDDGFDASPVIIGNEIYLKGAKHLYCIAAG